MADLKKLRTQNQISHDENPKILYKCEICDKEFNKNDELKKHIKNVHDIVNEHHCNICQKRFKIQSKLTLHIKNCS